MSNKALWDSVCMTNPEAVKPITGKTYKGNSPKPYWLIERATEVFGPVGIGWGCTVKSERFERLGEHDVLHVAVVSVWYVHNGVRSETFDQMGGTKAAYMTAGSEKAPPKLIVDEDAGKKSVTDGMVKCLSMIGFAGDIFSGRWDDSKYVAEAAAHYSDKERAQQRSEWLEEQAMLFESCETLTELTAAWKSAYKVMQAENDTDAIQTLEPIKDRMKATITEHAGAKA